MKWHIGCSGFHYRDWKDVFYPAGLPQRKWFDYYSSQFDTLELNVTFYRFPQVKFLKNWYAISPAHFSFAVKAPRLITHYKQFNDCENLLAGFCDTVEEGLSNKLGTVLFQLPPAFAYTPERLERIIQNMRPGLNNVLEFRHASWWDDTIYKRLKKEQIIFSGISHPTLPDKAVINNKLAYYRFHGVPKLYYSAYSHETLQKIADELITGNKVRETYIYFNNTATMGAIENATWLKKYVAGELVTQVH
jgi:uncharacterized protein YecE (DUF72 family)